MKLDNKRVEIEDDYQVHSKIANSGGMGGLIEGYPVIKRNVFDFSHLDPDECEYSEEITGQSAFNECAGIGEEYFMSQSRKHHIRYDD